MLGNSCMLDANAVLRFLLQDIDEQFHQVKTVIRTKKCYVTHEVLAEVCRLPFIWIQQRKEY